MVDHEVGALLNGISVLRKETPESSLVPSTTEDTVKRQSSESQETGLPLDTESSSVLILDFQPLELGQIKFCCL